MPEHPRHGGMTIELVVNTHQMLIEFRFVFFDNPRGYRVVTWSGVVAADRIYPVAVGIMSVYAVHMCRVCTWVVGTLTVPVRVSC